MPKSKKTSQHIIMGVLVLGAGVLGVSGVVGFSTLALTKQTSYQSQAYEGVVKGATTLTGHESLAVSPLPSPSAPATPTPHKLPGN